MTKTSNFIKRLTALVASSNFFRVTVGLFVVQAVWIALSGRYPMAFDEDFHLGIIRLYAHHPYPFWSGQPAGGDAFGAVARDPSYLYHYLMSFPYRLIVALTANQTTQIVALRLINVALFTAGLLLYRRLLLKTGASRALVHLCVLLFVLLPVVPLLAAQINYDNLLLPLTAGSLLLALQLSGQLKKRQAASLRTFALLLMLCLLTSIVKYAFLPLFAAIMGFVLVRTWQLYGVRGRLSGQSLRKLAVAGYKSLSLSSRLGLAAGLVVAGGLFSQRYVVNLVEYHTPVPDCGQVLTVRQCSQYGPWSRDYKLANTKTSSSINPVVFMNDWLYGMWLRTFFAVDGPATNFQTRGPLALPALSTIGAVSVAAVAFVFGARRVWRRYDSETLWLFMAGAAVYVAALWLDEYREYVNTGQPVAINGRYLLPVLLPLMLIGAMSVVELMRRWRWPRLALATTTATAATAMVVCLLWGGGALTYILRSNDAWYGSVPVVRPVNHLVQRTVGPLTPGYKRPTQFLH